MHTLIIKHFKQQFNLSTKNPLFTEQIITKKAHKFNCTKSSMLLKGFQLNLKLHFV